MHFYIVFPTILSIKLTRTHSDASFPIGSYFNVAPGVLQPAYNPSGFHLTAVETEVIFVEKNEKKHIWTTVLVGQFAVEYCFYSRE